MFAFSLLRCYGTIGRFTKERFVGIVAYAWGKWGWRWNKNLFRALSKDAPGMEDKSPVVMRTDDLSNKAPSKKLTISH